MKISSINYTVKTATEHEIRSHLSFCNDCFSPPLSQRVDIVEYSKKIFDKAITFEAWHDKDLVGLVAAYFNDSSGNFGYITSASVKYDYIGEGIATTLMSSCLSYARQCGFKSITLEVFITNFSAIRLYKKFGFKETEIRGETALMTLCNLEKYRICNNPQGKD